jgi:hypothetical protein
MLFLAASANAQAPGVFTVYFGLGEAALDTAGHQTVADAAASYMQTGAARVEVTGYADRSGSADFNQALSARRAEAVRVALVQRGVPDSSVSVDAEGEGNPAVMTADGQREARNRRVEIAVSPPPPPAPVAEAMPPPPAATTEPMAEGMLLGRFSLGGLYGFNLKDEGGTGSDDKTSHLAGVNLGFDYGLNEFVALSLEQALFYNFFSGDSGLGGRSAGGLDFTIGRGNVIPHVGGNIGYIYGSGIEDDFFAGPEIGINLFGFDAKVAYDMPFGRSLDEGIVMATIGLGIRF